MQVFQEVLFAHEGPGLAILARRIAGVWIYGSWTEHWMENRDSETL
jgi:hypothetical protein